MARRLAFSDCLKQRFGEIQHKANPFHYFDHRSFQLAVGVEHERELWYERNRALLPQPPPVPNSDGAPSLPRSDSSASIETFVSLPVNVPRPKYKNPDWAKKYDKNDDIIRFTWHEDQPFALVGTKAQVECGLEPTIFAAYPFLSLSAWILYRNSLTSDPKLAMYRHGCIDFCHKSLTEEREEMEKGMPRPKRTTSRRIMEIILHIKQHVQLIWKEEVIFDGRIDSFEYKEKSQNLLICGYSDNSPFYEWFLNGLVPRILAENSTPRRDILPDSENGKMDQQNTEIEDSVIVDGGS